MLNLESMALPAAVVVLAVGLLLVILWAKSHPASTQNGAKNPETHVSGKRPRGAAIKITCNRCGNELEIFSARLQRLQGVERALTISSHPELAQRELAESACPHCTATHCFVREPKGWAWAGSNLYVPQGSMAHCAECGKGIGQFPAPPENEESFANARDLDATAGIRCMRCDALVCISCLLRNTHGYTPGAALVCPRCGRAAVGPPLKMR